jgi:hypothetical protein
MPEHGGDPDNDDPLDAVLGAGDDLAADGDDELEPHRARGKKTERDSYEWLANRALGRARRVLKASEKGAPNPEVELLLASANVLATLELASAIRSITSPGDNNT